MTYEHAKYIVSIHRPAKGGKAMTGIRILLGVALTALAPFSALAQHQCSRVGEEFCINGQTYRCEKTGSEMTPIFQNRSCTVSTQTMEGNWRGSGHQTPAGARGSDYPVSITISGAGGKIDYPSLQCGGSLVRISGDATAGEYRERLTYGGNKCVDGGNVILRLFRGKLSYTWSGQPGTVIGVLDRN